MLYSLDFLKSFHVQYVHLLSQYTPNNDVGRGEASEYKASIFELAKFDEHWISRYQFHKNFASITSFGIVQ